VSTELEIAANLLALAVMPFALVGTINRVKSRWAGRRGPPIFQSLFDFIRLLRKTPVYSSVTTPVFRIGPLVVLVTSIASAMVVPLCGTASIAAFPFDFVWFAYVWAFGRVAIILGALDTGSSFEGMGASREATFATLLEPVLFLVAGALCLHTRERELSQLLMPELDSGPALVMWGAAIVALLIVVQVEAARMPIDDPTTHLELTMVHEVMILDHSGPELAFLQLGAAIKLFVGISVIATLVNPSTRGNELIAIVLHVGLCLGLAVALGLVESLIARLKLRVVPQYIVVGLVAGGVALLSMLGRVGVAG
jgi:formate hydrogenlyase subunit 4